MLFRAGVAVKRMLLMCNSLKNCSGCADVSLSLSLCGLTLLYYTLSCSGNTLERSLHSLARPGWGGWYANAHATEHDSEHCYRFHPVTDLGFFKSRDHNGATLYREGPSLTFKSCAILKLYFCIHLTSFLCCWL